MAGCDHTARVTTWAAVFSVPILIYYLLRDLSRDRIRSTLNSSNNPRCDVNLHWSDKLMSFPSRRTTVAFALPAVLAARLKNPWASVVLYGAAAVAAVSGMYSYDHRPSDKVFAAAYTTAVARSVGIWFERHGEQSANARALSILPTPRGVSIVWRFYPGWRKVQKRESRFPCEGQRSF